MKVRDKIKIEIVSFCILKDFSKCFYNTERFLYLGRD